MAKRRASHYLYNLVLAFCFSSTALAQSAREEGSSFAKAVREFRLTEIVELENKINALEQQLVDAKNTTEADKNALQRRISGLEGVLSNYETRFGNTEQLLNQFGLSQEDLAAYLEEQQVNGEIISNLRRDLQATQTELEQSRQMVDEIRSSREVQASSLEDALASVDAINGLLAVEQQKSNTLEQRLTLKEQQLVEATQENKQINQQLSELEQVQAALDSARQELKNKALENSQSPQMSKQLERLQSELASVQLELSNKSAELDNATAELSAVRQQSSDPAGVFASESANTELEIQQYRNEIRALAESLNRKEAQFIESEKRNAILQAKLGDAANASTVSSSASDSVVEGQGNDSISNAPNTNSPSSWASLDDAGWYVEFDESGPTRYLSFDEAQNLKSQLPEESKCDEFATGFLLDDSLEARLSQDGFAVNSFWVVRDNTRLAICRLQKVANEYRGLVRRQAPSRVDFAIAPVQR